MRPLVAIAAFALVASLFYAASRQPDEAQEPAPGEVVPLAGRNAPRPGPPPGFAPRVPLPPPPRRDEGRPRPTPDEEEEERGDMERLIETLGGGAHEIQEEEIREAFGEEDPTAQWAPEPDPEDAEDLAVDARRRRTMRARRQHSLDLVELLQRELAEELEAAREAGDEERAAWLEASARRLETRRAALQRAIAELDAADRDDEVTGGR